jgi:phage terminase small subunit
MQRRFVAEFVVDCNGTQAARRAGYSPKTAHVQACVLLKNPKVWAAIEAQLEAQLREVGLTAARVKRELVALAFSDLTTIFDETGALLPPHEWPRGMRAAVSSIKVSSGPDGDRVAEIRLWDKSKPLEILARYFKVLDRGDSGETDTNKLLLSLLEQSFEDRLKAGVIQAPALLAPPPETVPKPVGAASTVDAQPARSQDT